MSLTTRCLGVALAAIAGALTAPAAHGQRAAAPINGAIFLCGQDATLPDPISVRWSTVVLAGDGRLFTPCSAGTHTEAHREVREAALLAAALQSREVAVRRAAVQAIARTRPAVGSVRAEAVVRAACREQVLLLGTPATPLRWHPGELFRLLADADRGVREDAAYGIGLQLSRPNLDADVAIGARAEIEACLARQRETPRVSPSTITLRQEPVVRGLLLEALGVTRYGANDQRDLAEAAILGNVSQAPEEILGAAKGLEALFRQDPRRSVGARARERLREWVMYGARATNAAPDDVAARIRRLSLQALVTIRDDDPITLTRAAGDGDWQVRRLVALGLSVSRPEHATVAAQLAVDPVFQVRYETLGAYARDVTRTRQCEPITAHLDDPEPLVAMRAMDALTTSCTDLDPAVSALVPLADRLGKPESHVHWHLPARALSTLARIRPEEARSRLAAAVAHPVWQVRAAAAAAGAALGSDREAVALARDEVPNVRTAAIEALVRLKSPAAVPAAIDALNSGMDHQLLRSAATALRAAPEPVRDEAVAAVLGALHRLTEIADDTSRDPRVALLDRLGELLPPARSGDLLPFTRDFDDEVIAAARRAFTTLASSEPAPSRPYRRYPLQPDEQTLSSLPKLLEIELDGGVVSIELLPQVAPVTIARVAALATRGYYAGLTFHRIVPNFVVQGGSPGANEYVGDARYMRDEPGLAPHLRGAVGISTRGRDTGDAQLFIDLVDVPRLDRDYTVFGYVRSGMEFVDRMLEGAVIKSVSVR